MGNFFVKLETHINKDALVHCICFAEPSIESDQRAEQYIKNPFFVQHCTSRGESPLYLSLLHNKDNIALMLLAHDADPNARPPIDPIYSTISHPFDPLLWCFFAKNISQIKLITLYGANIERFSERDLTPFAPGMLQAYAEARARYLHIQELESLIKSDAPIAQKLTALEKLQKIWQTISQEEENPIFKHHYYEKALNCKNRTENLQVSLTPNDKRTSLDDPYQSLLGRKRHAP